MPLLEWGTIKNLEYSLYEYLKDTFDGFYVFDIYGNQKPLTVNIGNNLDDSWKLPTISVYIESETINRLEIGSNLRDEVYLINLFYDGSRYITFYKSEDINDAFKMAKHFSRILNLRILKTIIFKIITNKIVSFESFSFVP